MLNTRFSDADCTPRPHRRGGRLFVAFFILFPSFVARPAHALWQYPNSSGYVLAQVANGSATINPTYSYSFGASNITIQYQGVGYYLVTFPDLWNPLQANDGHVQVTASGSNSRCKVTGWDPGNQDPNCTVGGLPCQDLIVGVSCFSPSGAPQDSSFRASWVEREDISSNNGSTEEGGYVWVYDAYSSYYAADSAYSWNSTGQPMTVTHTPGSGLYGVLFTGQFGGFDWATPDTCSAVPSFNGGTVEVTAYGGGNDYCNPVGWGYNADGAIVNVACFNGSTGAPDDSAFDVAFDTMSPTAQENSAFVWANQPTTSSYSPASGWTADIVSEGDGYACPYYVTGTTNTTDAATITRSSTGSYSVFFPDIRYYPSIFHTTAYGTSGNYCSNDGTHAWNGTGVQLSVLCFSPGGSMADTEFVVTFGS